MNFVLTEKRDRIAYILLNRPDKKNALNDVFVDELKLTFKQLNLETEIRAIVLKSTGDAFCAGADLGYLQKLQTYTFEENLNDSKNLAELFTLIYSSSKPVVSLVNGPALAGGCGLATVCDFCFATPESTFGYTESRIGFIPAIVMVFLRKKIGETLSKKLLFTGEVFDAKTAFDYGLVTEIINKGEIDELVHQKLVKLISHSSGNSISMIKQMYNRLDSMSFDESIEFACKMNAQTRESEDCKKGIAAFLNKQKLSW